MRKIIIIACICMLVPVLPIQAAQADTTNTLEVSIADNLQATVKYTIFLSNNYANDYISKFNVTLPFPKASGVIVKSEQIPLDYNSELSGDYLILHIDLRVLELQPSVTRSIEITFNTDQAIKTILGYHLFQYDSVVPSNNLSHFNLVLKVPALWGHSLYLGKNVTEKNLGSQIEYDYRLDDRNLFLVWGDHVAVEIKSQFDVQASAAGNFLVNIPASSSNQFINWDKFADNATGFYDKNDNQFIAYLLSPGTNSVAYSGKIELDYTSPNNDHSNLATTTRQLPNLPDFDRSQSKLSLLQSIYQYTVRKLSPLLATEVQINELNKSDFATPIEYCYLMTALAGKHGIPSRLNYGVQIFPIPTDFNNKLPHVWCEFDIDGQIYTADPYLEDMTGNEFLLTSRLGKISFGSFQLNDNEYPVFGLLNNSVQPLPTISASDASLQHDVPFLNIDKIQNDNGTFNIDINNPSNQIFPISAAKVNDIDLNILVNNALRPLLLPQQINNYHFHTTQSINSDTKIKLITGAGELNVSYDGQSWHQDQNVSMHWEYAIAALLVIIIAAVIVTRKKFLRI